MIVFEDGHVLAEEIGECVNSFHMALLSVTFYIYDKRAADQRQSINARHFFHRPSINSAHKFSVDNNGPEDSNPVGEIYQIRNGWHSITGSDL
jgi:hypothetical protein